MEILKYLSIYTDNKVVRMDKMMKTKEYVVEEFATENYLKTHPTCFVVTEFHPELSECKTFNDKLNDYWRSKRGGNL